MADKDLLTMYVIYDHPKDFPDDIIVRAHTAQMDGRIEVRALVRKFASIEVAREWLRHMGLYPVPRDGLDDKSIVESWL